MEIAQESAAKVVEHALDALGLPGFDVTAREVCAAALRRGAAFLCPTEGHQLLRTVKAAMAGLPGMDDTDLDPEAVLASLIGSGDLLELPVEGYGGVRRQLFLGPPAFVRRTSDVVVLGVRADGAPLVSDELLRRLVHEGHTRHLPTSDIAAEASALLAEGLSELTFAQWIRAPSAIEASKYLATFRLRLDAASDPGDIGEVRVIDPDRDVAYYRGRWRPAVRNDDGVFVARRRQAFGAELWCFVRLEAGRPVRLIDLPVENRLEPAFDEAWRLQAALDALGGHAQQLRMRRIDDEEAVVDLFSPVPSWGQRGLEAAGGKFGPRSKGALFSFQLPTPVASAQARMFQDLLWVATEDESGPMSHGT